ncbi:hypothetical protein LTR10_005787 [Elasticomyces elasticus]|nr:hypothetical protein LTR10_005787 [Elasticomyces elasticus]
MMDHTEDLTELPIAPAHGIIPVEIPAILDKARRQMCHQLSQNIDNLHNKFNLQKKREYGDLTIRKMLGCLATDCFEAGQNQRLVSRLLEYSDSQIQGMCMICKRIGRVHATDCGNRPFDMTTPVTSEEVVCKFIDYGDSQMEGICITCLMPGSLHATDCVNRPSDATTPVAPEEGWTPRLRELRKPYWKSCEPTTHHGWPALAIMAEAAATELGDSFGNTYGGDDSEEFECPDPGSMFEEGGSWYLADRAMGLSSSE